MEKQIEITNRQTLSDARYPLRKITYREGKSAAEQQREVYERPDSATVLLYNREKRSLVLTRQFRLPVYLREADAAFFTEACAGLMDGNESPEACIRREALEETGYVLDTLEKVGEVYTSPGAVTERSHLYVAPYDHGMKQGEGGGLEEEHEHITVLELPFEEALDMLRSGAIKDAKTMILLQYLQLHVFGGKEPAKRDIQE